jgi:tetratricopeptide (TPR) repeat protein
MEEAIALRPDFTRARQELERVAPGTNRAANENELSLLQSESAKAPGRLDLMQSLGEAAVRAGQYDLAIYTYQKLLDGIDPASDARGDIYLKLGDTYLRKGDSPAALQALEQARKLSPGNRRVAGPLLVLLEAAGRHTEAAQLRTEIASARENQAALTTQFLNDEIRSAEQRLADLQGSPSRDAESIRQAEFRLAEIRRRAAAAAQVQQPAGRVLESIYVAGMSEVLKQQLHLPVHVGDTLTEDTLGATYSTVKILDGSLEVRFTVQDNGKVRLVIDGRK